MQLENVGLDESGEGNQKVAAAGSEDFKRHLEANILKFSFQDGRVDAVCASSVEPEWVVNIKKGVLSAFQNSMLHFETDQTIQEVCTNL